MTEREILLIELRESAVRCFRFGITWPTVRNILRSAAVEAHRQSAKTDSAIARLIRVNRNSLRRWRRAA